MTAAGTPTQETTAAAFAAPQPAVGGRRLALWSLLGAVLLLALPAVASAATVSGTAFEDFNDNGARNQTPMVDSGVGGITVTAYNSKGKGKAVATTTTAADGTYTLTVPDKFKKVRVEFTNLPPGYQPDRHGTNSGTTVQFVKGSASNVDVGTLQPANFCQDNPKLAVACMKFGGHTDASLNANAASIRIVPDTTPDDLYPTNADDANEPVPGEVTGALFSQTGTVFGVVEPTASDFLYSAAFTKRHADWGPGGPGAIYRTDIDQANAGTPNGSLFFDVNTLASAPAGAAFTRAAGPDPTGLGGWGNDANAWDQVGNSGLGNLSSNLDGSELYTVGLATGELIRIPIPADGSSPGPGSVGTFAIPSPCANPDDARPMGTGVKDGLVYVGGVCSMASVGNPPPQPATNDLSVYVYTFDPASGAFSANPVLDTPLEADRLCSGRNNTGGGFPAETCVLPPPDPGSADWHPWTSVPTQNVGSQYPQPMLSDIEFVGDDLVLGIRDRSSDQRGCCGAVWPDGTVLPVPPSGVQTGYNLRACPTGGAYQLESGGACGGLTGAFPNTPKYGPGDGLFYDQTYTSTNALEGAHDYVGLGGVLAIPGYPQLRETATDAADDAPSSSAGVRYLNHADGSYAKGYNLFRAGIPGQPPAATFGKSNGLGDLEALCEAAPIEIGNYVWLDPDRDGIQDPGEKKLSKVKVQLLDASGKKIAQTKTDGQGQYYFNESNVPGAVQPNTAYTVNIPLKQKVLKPYVPTKPDKSEQLRDSDGIKKGKKRVIDELSTGAAGHNDHTHDFGFYKPKLLPKLRIDKAVSKKRVDEGEVITYTLVARNVGKTVAKNVRVCDNLPRNITPVSLAGGELSNGQLCWELKRLGPNKSKEFSFKARVDRDAGPGTLPNTATVRGDGNRKRMSDRDDAAVEVATAQDDEEESQVTG